MGVLPTELLPSVSHVDFSVFNLAVPNIAAWGVLLLFFALAVWARLPRLFEPRD